jgi:formate--tetrahydrofolate ligase
LRSDIEIAQATPLKPITELAAEAGIPEAFLEPYGRTKAKLNLELFDYLRDRPKGKLIYVTAVTPTPAGEGKTTTAIGLTQAFGKLGKKVMLCLREPSLGPMFGVKGGATGGGYAQILPMEEINLHFTGDIHAVTAAHNLLSALLDNHITQGNTLRIDPKRVVWRRVMDISDRELRNIVIGMGAKSDGVIRESGFDITAASEIMAILCLTANIVDLKERLGRILVAYNDHNEPVYVRDLKAVGAMAVLLKEAIKPNLVQTMEGQPVLVHGGPFANIAHGNNSIIATRMALQLADYAITEGGFAADLGAEKFFDIVSRIADIQPDLAILVVSARALKYHGGAAKEELTDENLPSLAEGTVNLERHLNNLRYVYKLPVVVAINRFPADSDAEIEFLVKRCREYGARVAVSEVVSRGGEGGLDLAREVLEGLKEPSHFRPLYHEETALKEKIQLIATKVYGAIGINITREAEKALQRLEEMGHGKLPVCIAKTQMSLSDDSLLRGAPEGWVLTIREVRLFSGAGFVVAIAGNIMTMPGLPKIPAAELIDLLPDGRITGLI